MPLSCLTNILENLRKLTTEKQKLIGDTHKKRQIYIKKKLQFSQKLKQSRNLDISSQGSKIHIES